MKKLNAKKEGMLSIIAALIVLFSSLWDPKISMLFSVVALVSFSMYKFNKR